MNRPTKILLGLVAFGVLFLGFYLLRPPPPPQLQPLPNPNGYDDFVKAGQIVDSISHHYRTLKLEELRSLVSSNSAALRLVREGLNRKCQVPTEFSKDYFERHISELTLFKSLALALAAEGQLAEMEGRTNDAVRIYLEAIRFSHEFPRSGLGIDKLVGLNCEAIGSRPLGQLVPDLNAKECRQAIRILETVDAKNESIDDVLDHERQWARRAFSWKERIAGLLAFKSMQSVRQNLIKKTNDSDKQRRLLMLQLAARAFELEKGQRPGGYADLVPAYLKIIPQDPHTGTNLLYDFR